jgi:hypothetical protein
LKKIKIKKQKKTKFCEMELQLKKELPKQNGGKGVKQKCFFLNGK